MCCMIDAMHFAQGQTPWGLAGLTLPPGARMGQSHGRMGHAVLLPVAYVPHETRASTVQRALRLGADSVGCVYEPQAWRMLGQPTLDDEARVAVGDAHGLYTAMAVCMGPRQHLLVRAADELWMRNDAERAVHHVQDVLARRRADGPWIFCDQRFALLSALAPQAVTLHAEVCNDDHSVRLQQRLLSHGLVPTPFMQTQPMLEHLHAWQQDVERDGGGLTLTALPPACAQAPTRATARVAWRVVVPGGTDQCAARGCVRFVLPSGLGVEVEAFAQHAWPGADGMLAQLDDVLAGVGALL